LYGDAAITVARRCFAHCLNTDEDEDADDDVAADEDDADDARSRP
jgi:hypothetical protein